jgi:hypothetical protein
MRAKFRRQSSSLWEYQRIPVNRPLSEPHGVSNLNAPLSNPNFIRVRFVAKVSHSMQLIRGLRSNQPRIRPFTIHQYLRKAKPFRRFTSQPERFG